MGLPSSATAFVATFENPHLHYPNAFAEPQGSWGQEEWAAQARALCDWWMGDRNPETGASLRPRSPEANGCMAAYEVDEGGTPHIHFFCCSRNPIRPGQLFSRLADAKGGHHFHLEACRAGSVREVEEYLEKADGGPHAGKAPTRRSGLVRAGELFAVGRSGARPDALRDADELLDSGASVDEIVARGVEYGRLEPAILAVAQARARGSTPLWRNVDTTWKVGPTGCGKTRSYLDLCAELGREGVCRVTDYAHPFDSYGSQEVLFLDELRPGDLPRGLLLQLLDGYPLDLPARYRNRQAAWTRVVVASPLGPEAFFSGADEGRGDSLEQLGRRIDRVCVHYPEPGADPPYGVGELTWAEYRSVGYYAGVRRLMGW